MDRSKSRHKQHQKGTKRKGKKRRRKKKRKQEQNKPKEAKTRAKRAFYCFNHVSIESNEPKFLSMDTDESEFSAFPQDPAGVAKKL